MHKVLPTVTVLVGMLLATTASCFAQNKPDGWYLDSWVAYQQTIHTGIICDTKRDIEKFLEKNFNLFNSEKLHLVEHCVLVKESIPIHVDYMHFYESIDGYAVVLEIRAKEPGVQYFLDLQNEVQDRIVWKYAPRL